MATLVQHHQHFVYAAPSPVPSMSPGSPKAKSVASSSGSSISSSDSSDLNRCKRRIAFGYNSSVGSGTGGSAAPPATVARRNARERNRVKQVNLGFANLRQHIPMGGSKSKKVSKVETLKCAVEYIKNLQRLVTDHDSLNGLVSSSSHQDHSAYFPGTESLENTEPMSSRTYETMQTLSPCSEASSPTPSYDSERSQTYLPPTTATAAAVAVGLPVYDHYDAYEPMSPEDEVLLDAISWWQQSQ